MKKIAIVVVVFLLSCAAGKGQSCSIQSGNPNFKYPNVLSGSAFVPNSQQVNGSGVGPWVNGSANSVAPQYNFDSEVVSGDRTITAQMTHFNNGVSALTSTGIIAWRTVTSGSVGIYFSYNGGFYVTMEQMTFANNAYTSTIIGQQPINSPYWIKLAKTSGSGGFASFSGYYSSDGTNWNLLGTVGNVVIDSQLYYGLYTASGDTTHVTNATWQNVSGLDLTMLTDFDVDEGVPGSSYAIGSANSAVQAGQLFIGPNQVAGQAVVIGCGSGNTLNVNNEVVLTDLTTGQQPLFTDQNFTPTVTPCDSTCTYSYMQQPTAGGAYGPFTLVSGHQYKITNVTALNIPGKVSSPSYTWPTLLNP